MQQRLFPVLAAFMALLAARQSAYASDESTPRATTFRAGVASANVSPPTGSFIAGDARNRRFAAIHDPLHAKAVAVGAGESTIALLVVDNIGITHPDIEAIRRRAVELSPVATLTPERIIVTSTHSHSGPDVVGLWGEDELASGRDPAYMAWLIETSARQIAAAAASMQPVTLRVASGDHRLEWVQNVTEPQLLDRRVSVLQMIGANDRTVATLTNFACHPTVMDAVSDQVSSDYVAGFYRVMSERLGGEHLFLQGAIGGWVQPDKTARSFERADQYGAEVAATALDLLERAKPIVGIEIRFASRRLDLPIDNPGWIALLNGGVLHREQFGGALRTEVAWFAIGDVEFVTHPGETSPAYSLASRRLMRSGNSFVLGLALDALGYILKPEYFVTGAAFPSAEYLTATSLGPQTGPLLLDALESIVPGRTQPSSPPH